MYFEIYIDQFFAEQFLFGYLLLYLTVLALGEEKAAWRLLTAAFFFALFQCGYLFTGNRWLSAAGLFLASFAVFERNRKIRGIFFLFLITFCFGGTIQAILSLFPVPASAGALTAFFLLRFLRKKFKLCRQMQEQEARVSLFWENRSMTFLALIDTGNRLKEPLTRQPVSILDMESARKFLGDNWEEKKGCFLVPYHSIGRERGWMRAVMLDKMCVNTTTGESEIEKPLFAVSNEKINLKDRYQVILNPEHIKI